MSVQDTHRIEIANWDEIASPRHPDMSVRLVDAEPGASC